jgi:integrase
VEKVAVAARTVRVWSVLMAGHVTEKRPGVWEMRVYMGRDPLTGKKLWETGTVEAAGKKEAQLACDAFALEVKGAAPDARTMTVGQLLERWYRHGAARRLWSPGTELLHRRQIDTTFAALRDKPLAQLRPIDLDDFYDALRTRGSAKDGPLTVATVRRRAGILSLALDQAVRWELIRSNPAKAAQPGKLKKRKPTPPDTAQVQALLLAAGERDKEWLTYLFLDAEAGARRGEVAALRLTDFGADCVTIARALTVRGPLLAVAVGPRRCAHRADREGTEERRIGSHARPVSRDARTRVGAGGDVRRTPRQGWPLLSARRVPVPRAGRRATPRAP